MKSNYFVPAEVVKVVVNNGWVSIDGEVEWDFQRCAAERAIRYLIGVVGVTNNVTVKPCVSTADVKHKIEDAFKRNAELDARRVDVSVLDGKVTLRGTVQSWSERNEAQHAAWSASEIRSVENLITISP